MFFEETIHSDNYIHLILIPLLIIKDRNRVLVLHLHSDHYIHLILIPLLSIKDRNSVLVLHLGQRHGPHSKFLSECTRRGVLCMVDNSHIVAS